MNIKLKFLEKFFYVVVFIFVLFGVYFSKTDLRYYEGVYVREDGLIEWLTVLALCMGAFVCFYRIFILKPFRDKIFLFALAALGFLFLFGAGEEISWGQRIFDIKSSEFFLKNNSQMETNFHNLVVSGVKINKLIFGLVLGIIIGCYFLVLPFLYDKFSKVKGLVNKLAIPVPKVFHLLVYLSLFGIVQLIDGGKKGEILEFGGCWIFLLMLFEPKNRDVFSRKMLKH